MKRFGQIIKVKPEHFGKYKEYHAKVWPEILDMISKCNIRNYSIYHRDGFLFAYFEYHGNDFEGDMAKMAADPKTQEWWDVVKPFQEPISTHSKDEWWVNMEEVFHLD
jgi:L-rhamnose mutarotase